MSKKKTFPHLSRTTVETYSGSLAELAIAATKADRELSWDQLDSRIREQINAPTGRTPVVRPADDDEQRPALSRAR